MNENIRPDPDLDAFVKRTLRDDLPPEAEARMRRHFLELEFAIEQEQQSTGSKRWISGRWYFRREILAFASAAMLILGIVMQLGGSQSALAHSIEQLKVTLTISAGLNRAFSMDCAVLQHESGENTKSYRVRWNPDGRVRVDRTTSNGAQTLWIGNETVSITDPASGSLSSMSLNTMIPGPVWQPALEFMSPKVLARHIERNYGLMQGSGRMSSKALEFVIAGRDGAQDVEITVDENTYLPKMIREYLPGTERICILEARFLWNQPISSEVFHPRVPAAAK